MQLRQLGRHQADSFERNLVLQTELVQEVEELAGWHVHERFQKVSELAGQQLGTVCLGVSSLSSASQAFASEEHKTTVCGATIHGRPVHGSGLCAAIGEDQGFQFGLGLEGTLRS